MIITLIAFGILVLGIILAMMANKFQYSYEMHAIHETLSTVGCTMAAVGSIVLFVAILFIINAQCNIDKKIYDANMKYESLVKQVESINSDYEDISNIEVIQKVYNWNTYVHNCIYYYENPWTSWFNNKRFTYSLNYIELEGAK